MESTPPTSVVDLLRTAKPEEIRNRLAEVEGERKALRTLLRSLEARERTANIIKKVGGK